MITTVLSDSVCIFFFTKKKDTCDNSSKELDNCNSVKDIFRLVKDTVKEILEESRAGLDIGLAELGNKSYGLVSAFYPVGSNIIVLNKTPLRRIMETEPKLLKPYLFAILLHEYLHSLGYFNEEETRKMSYAICRKVLGEEHLATQISLDTASFFPYLLYPGGHCSRNDLRVVEVEETDYIG
jgi:hypothetical protein